MHVETVLDGTADEVFAAIAASVSADRAAAEKGADRSQAPLGPGTCWERQMTTKMGLARHVEVRVDEFCPGRAYGASITSQDGTYTVRWHIDDGGEGRALVTYEEEFFARSLWGRLNERLMALVTRRWRRRSMGAAINGLEAAVQVRRDRAAATGRD